jgi:RluA family pseudouridine synthase
VIAILFKDDDLLAVNKPAGLAAVPGGWEQEAPNLLDELEAEHGRLWIVHRLDKITSGVVVFARNPDAHRALSLAFETRAVLKIYLAIACGTPDWDAYTCRLPLLADVGHSHRTVINKKKGREALTLLRVRERFTDHILVDAEPHTGRTHQIRAHLSALGFPILADRLYGARPTGLIDRPALHAASLTLDQPLSGKKLTLTAPLPEDFTGCLALLRSGKT